MNRIKKYAYKILDSHTIILIARIKITLKLYIKCILRILLGRYKKNKDNDYPTTLQLPITYKCNFDCVMCGMRSLIHEKDFSVIELKKILSDKLFLNIRSVGVNGGEPFILTNLDEYIKVLLSTLPNLEDIYIISNGYYTEKILALSEKIKSLCSSQNIRYHLSLSIDGYGEMQDKMRGKSGAFKHFMDTYELLKKDISHYCDELKVICTITKINVYNLPELEVWADLNKMDIDYNIATIHKRICNEDKYQDFSVFTDTHTRMMAAEFFYSKYLQTNQERYFGLFYVVKNGKRISACSHRTRAVTLTPNGQLSYCATHSDEIENCLEKSANEIFYSIENIKYRKCMHNEFCASCTHYSASLKQKEFMSLYVKEQLKPMKIYRR